MKIKIAGKINPFSRSLETEAIIPSTCIAVKIFPMKLIFESKDFFSKNESLDLFLDIKGPLKNFQVFQNIDQQVIKTTGFLKEGYFEYVIGSFEDKIFIKFIKAPFEKVNFILKEKKIQIGLKEPFYLPLKTKKKEKVILEKLSLGMHKKQDIELIQRRENLREILPLWFCLGQMVPSFDHQELEGVAHLFVDWEKEKEIKERQELLLNIYKAGFNSLFSPSLEDKKHQGIVKKANLKTSGKSSPLILLKKGYEIIRSLFMLQKENTIEILLCLLPLFDCGRMVNLYLEKIGYMDLEWSKKMIKKIILKSFSDQEIFLKLPSSIKTFRIRQEDKELKVLVKTSEPIKLQENKTYYFDRFQK